MATTATLPAKPATNGTIPTLEDVRALCSEEGPCLSIYLGPRKAGSGDGSASVRLRAILKGIERTAEERGMNPTDAETFLAPLLALDRDPGFSAGHHDGLGLFRSPRVFRVFRLPDAPAEDSVFGAFFDPLPLLRSIEFGPPFYLLALSRKRARLFHAAPDGFEEVAFPPGITADFEEFKGLDLHETTWRNKTSSGGGNSLTFGAGADRDKESKHFRDFCVALDRGVNALPGSDPVVVAATATEQSTYREAASSPRLVREQVLLSPDGGYSTTQLSEKARAVMAGRAPTAALRALDHFSNAGPALTAVEGNAIVGAASTGRVAHLLIAEGAKVMGDYDAIAARTIWSGTLPARDENLAAAAACDTLRHGGSVWVLPADRMPAARARAALLRY